MSVDGAAGDAVPVELQQKLDVTSEHFNAAECLSVTDPSKVSLPFPNIQQLDNFKLCENLVPPALRAEVKAEFGVTVSPSVLEYCTLQSREIVGTPCMWLACAFGSHKRQLDAEPAAV
jgi:hypothetical protein